MKMKTLTAAALIAFAASTANAGDPGGLLNESVERDVDEPAMMLPQPSSSDPGLIVLAVLALLAAVAAGGGS